MEDLPAEVLSLLAELDFVYVPATETELDGYESTRIRYHVCLCIVRERGNRTNRLLQIGYLPPTWTGFIPHHISLDDTVKGVKEFLRKNGYPVDAILRTKRLHALLVA